MYVEVGKALGELTNKTQPDHTAQSDDSQNSETDPQRGRHVQTQPKETLIGGGDGPGGGIGGFEDPGRVTGGGVDFVPPAEADEATAGDVLEVVEVGGEEEKGEDEDEDTSFVSEFQ